MTPKTHERSGGLQIRDVHVAFGGIKALSDVSLRVGEGEVVGIIGPNGAGKTTLFNVICGFVAPSRGTMTWHGRPFRPRPRDLVGKGIARTVQGVGLCSGLTVLENVEIGADRHRSVGTLGAGMGLLRSARSERSLRTHALEALEAVGAASLAHRRPEELPYPEQKRVALARALASDPALLLLDEPAGGLGATDIEGLGDFIRAFASDGRRSVMAVEHHMDLVMKVCERIFVLDFGRIVAEGSPAEVGADPAVGEAYLGIAPGEASMVAVGGGS